MVMILIVPIEEAAAERFGVLDATEALRKLRLVFHGFEVAFRERIVIGGVRPAVRFSDAEIGEQQCRGLGADRLGSGATHGLWPRQTPALTIDAGARQVQSRARTGGEARRWRQRDDGIDHDASSLSDVASGRPSKAATFFWMAMMASACSNRRISRAFSRLACASSAINGLRGAGFGPRLIGVSPPRAPAARNPRQSLRVEEYRPSRRRIAAVPPAGARS